MDADEWEADLILDISQLDTYSDVLCLFGLYYIELAWYLEDAEDKHDKYSIRDVVLGLTTCLEKYIYDTPVVIKEEDLEIDKFFDRKRYKNANEDGVAPELRLIGSVLRDVSGYIHNIGWDWQTSNTQLFIKKIISRIRTL